jgi:integrase
MARPPLAMGTHGSISVKCRPRAATYVAYARFRDFDGVTRLVERACRSKTAAIAALQDEVRRRAGAPAAPLRPHHTFARAAKMWLAKLEAQVTEGPRAATTADTYRQRLRSVILPAMGQWRLRNVVRHRGKGLHRHAGKTETSLRIVPLPRFVVDMLAKREQHGPEVPVFPATTARGGFNWKDPNNMSTYIRQARQAAGMDWPVTSHTFRKTAATIWHDSGELTDRQKADLTGHAKISTLTDI